MARILVVDDEHNITELLTFILQKEGHTVVAAFDGQGCLDSLAEARPDLIILDVMLPGLDGYSVCTRLAEDDATRDIPVLILTGKDKMRDVFALSPNVVGYFDKPIEPVEFVARVGKIVAGRNA